MLIVGTYLNSSMKREYISGGPEVRESENDFTLNFRPLYGKNNKK